VHKKRLIVIGVLSIVATPVWALDGQCGGHASFLDFLATKWGEILLETLYVLLIGAVFGTIIAFIVRSRRKSARFPFKVARRTAMIIASIFFMLDSIFSWMIGNICF